MNLCANLKNRACQTRDFLLDLLFPVECLGCGREGIWICPDCFNAIQVRRQNSCFGCKKPNLFGEICPDCRKSYYLDGLWIAGDYENKILAQAVKKLKYNFIKGITPFLADFICRYLGDNFNPEESGIKANLKSTHSFNFLDREKSLIIPVPLHIKRENWRGFNQSALIAEQMAKNLGFKMLSGHLVRFKNNRPQASLKEAERLSNIAGCFKWQGNKLNGENIILVDDVATTGATLNECAKALKAGGAGEVWGLVAAKG